MAEIEHFVDPDNKDHTKFFMVENLRLPLWTADSQESNGPIESNVTVKEAVAQLERPVSSRSSVDRAKTE